MSARWVVWSAACALGVFAPCGADAQSARPDLREATVLRIDGDDLIVDAGRSVGMDDGTVFSVYRPIEVRHPVTRRPLRDRFLIGTARLSAAGSVLSIAHAQGTTARPLAVGDILVPLRVVPAVPLAATAPSTPAARERPAPVPRAPRAPAAGTARAEVPPRSAGAAEPAGAAPSFTPAAGATASATPPGVVATGVSDAEREAVGVWIATLGRPPELRVQVYQRFLRAHPASPYRENVLREIAWLTAVAAHADTTRDDDADEREPTLHVGGAPATSLREGDPAEVALQLVGSARYRAGMLNVRAVGAGPYRQIPLAPEGDGYVRARVPAERVRPPGYEFFVEVVMPDGHAVAVLGSAGEPRRVAVVGPPGPPRSTDGLSRIDVRAEAADVGTSADRPEYFLRVEGESFQRVQWGVMYGYRLGFGSYYGVGQPLCAYTAACGQGRVPAPPATSATVVFGYHEVEFAASDFVHVMARLEVGIDAGGVAVGGQARMRVGRERATNIVFGGDVFSGVGQRAFFLFNFFPHANVPCTAEGEVFNQQIDGGDPMFRFIAQVGYRFAPWVTLSLRGSYQLRRLDRGGFGGGLSTTFDW